MANIAIPEAHADNPLNHAMTLAPEASAAIFAFSKAVYQSSRLSLRLFEAVRTRLALINGCLTCQRFRAASGVPSLMERIGDDPGFGVHRNGSAPDEQFYAEIADWRSSSLYTPAECLALEYAERFSLEPDPLGYDGEFWGRMRAVFSDPEIFDMTTAIAYFVGVGRLMHVLGFDQISCPIDYQEIAGTGVQQAEAAE